MDITSTEFECKRGTLTIRGTEYRPAGDKLPIVIVSHGFMDDRNGVKRYARQFAKWGYAAYCFDFAGGCRMGKSDGATTDMTVYSKTFGLIAVDRKTQIRFPKESLQVLGSLNRKGI